MRNEKRTYCTGKPYFVELDLPQRERETDKTERGMKKIINYRLLVSAQCCQVAYGAYCVLQLNPSLQLRCNRHTFLIKGD